MAPIGPLNRARKVGMKTHHDLLIVWSRQHNNLHRLRFNNFTMREKETFQFYKGRPLNPPPLGAAYRAKISGQNIGPQYRAAYRAKISGQNIGPHIGPKYRAAYRAAYRAKISGQNIGPHIGPNFKRKNGTHGRNNTARQTSSRFKGGSP